MNPSLDCESACRLISRYLDGELDERSRSRLISHLAGCSACQSELEIHRRVWQLLEAASVPATPELDGLLERASSRDRVASMARRSVMGRVAPFARAAALLLFAAGGAAGGAWAAENRLSVRKAGALSEYTEFLGDSPAMGAVDSLASPRSRP